MSMAGTYVPRVITQPKHRHELNDVLLNVVHAVQSFGCGQRRNASGAARAFCIVMIFMACNEHCAVTEPGEVRALRLCSNRFLFLTDLRANRDRL